MDKLIILYGEQSAGKTSTLCKVFELLTGHTLAPTDPKPDFRIVFPIGKKWVYMATPGDSETVIKTNFNFFSQGPHGKTNIYEFNGNTFIAIEKKTLTGYLPRCLHHSLSNL